MGVRIVPGKKYTYAELEKIRMQDPLAAAKWSKKGYAWRQDMDGTMMLVHWKQTTNTRTHGELPTRGFASVDPDPFRLDELPPIVKRTPAERLDSLMAKISEDFKAGRVFTLDETNKNRPGRPKADRLDGEVVKEVAQTFLEDAENRAT